MDNGVLLTLDQLKSLQDFYVLHELGNGSFSNVLLASTKAKNEKVAIKVCNKRQILREKKTKSVFREKEALKTLSSAEKTKPFIVQLYCTFQDEGHLYFVLTYAKYKDISEKMMKIKTLDIDTTRHVIAELITAVAYCHSNNILHRDIKPANMLVKDDFHIMLTDFGECITFEENQKNIESEAKRKCSFVGSHLYVTPEVLQGKPVDETCDFFAIGSILFEFLTGKAPFHDLSEHLVFQRVIKNLYTFPKDIDEDAKKAIQGFLQPDPNDRLGSNEKSGFEGIKSTKFFEAINWDTLFKMSSPLAKYYTVQDEEEAAKNEEDELLDQF